MNITPTLMYWFTRLDAINELFAATVILASFGLFVFAMITAFVCSENSINIFAPDEDDKTEARVVKTIKKWFRALLVAIGIGTAGLVFTPSTREMAAIYIVPAIANNESVQKMATDVPEIMGLGTEWLKETLKAKVMSKKKTNEKE